MSGSALLGQPPLSADDKLIMKGIQLTSPSLLDAIPLISKHGDHDSRATSMIIGDAFAIALALTITIVRLAVRWSKLHTLGADDLMVIPACLSCVVYLSMNLASETAGCLGRHIYACTYEEFERFYYVSVKRPTYSVLLLESAACSWRPAAVCDKNPRLRRWSLVRPRELSPVLHHGLFGEDLHRTTQSANYRHDLQEMAVCSLDLPYPSHLSTPNLRMLERFPMPASRSGVFLQSRRTGH